MDDYQGAAFNTKPVVQLELDGSFIAEYESAAEAARFLGLEREVFLKFVSVVLIVILVIFGSFR